MKIQELLDASYEASSKASELTRQLAFAGIAVIWVLKVGTSSGDIPFSAELLIPMYCFVAGLAIDFGQYVYKTLVWSILNIYHWRKHRDNDKEVSISGFFNFLTHLMFWGKVILVSYGYFALLLFIQEKI